MKAPLRSFRLPLNCVVHTLSPLLGTHRSPRHEHIYKAYACEITIVCYLYDFVSGKYLLGSCVRLDASQCADLYGGGDRAAYRLCDTLCVYL